VLEEGGKRWWGRRRGRGGVRERGREEGGGEGEVKRGRKESEDVKANRRARARGVIRQENNKECRPIPFPPSPTFLFRSIRYRTRSLLSHTSLTS
jgi:hypothetical protein